ncbi:hypothetical protein OUN72_002800 [Salmonella enterica subsp. enterica serovar Essen]|nr:hypothetical protein [Salmonella enterica]
MFYPDNETGIDVMPEIAPKQSDTVKWFTKGGKGIAPTVPGQDTWNIWQAELLNILNLAGIKPDKTKLDQIAQAIKLIAGAVVDNKIGDGDYLEVSKNLEEIYEQGLVAQAEARAHIGINGDIAYRDKTNTFTEHNTFNGYVISNSELKICESNNKKLICDIWGDYSDLQYNTNFMRTRVVNGKSVDGAYIFYVNSPNELILEDTALKKQYTTWNSGNLTPVKTVNNVGPDAKGNVKVSTGTTYSNSASKSANGWFRDSSTGVIRQWGTCSLNTTVNFPIPFPTQCTSIQIAVLNSDPDDAMSVHDMTSSSFKPYNYWGNTGMQILWGADGY